MRIRDYYYIKPTINKGDHYEIEGVSRNDYATPQFIELTKEIVLDRKTAVLYSSGAGLSQSETRDATKTNARYVGTVPYYGSSVLIKELSAYSLHKWVGNMVNNELVVYASVNANTCASSMHSLWEAERLLREGIAEEVIVIAEERTSFNTIRIFKEHAIPLVVGDGLAVVRLMLDGEGPEIVETKWAYSYNKNPFGTTVYGYGLVDSEASVVKLHGTGTDNNTEAESVFDGRTTVRYKQEIGHTQGASALLELCMVVDDDRYDGRILCVASGLGNWYGSCILVK